MKLSLLTIISLVFSLPLTGHSRPTHYDGEGLCVFQVTEDKVKIHSKNLNFEIKSCRGQGCHDDANGAVGEIQHSHSIKGVLLNAKVQVQEGCAEATLKISGIEPLKDGYCDISGEQNGGGILLISKKVDQFKFVLACHIQIDPVTE